LTPESAVLDCKRYDTVESGANSVETFKTYPYCG
jgi:hypothetical protein